MCSSNVSFDMHLSCDICVVNCPFVLQLLAVLFSLFVVCVLRLGNMDAKWTFG